MTLSNCKSFGRWVVLSVASIPVALVTSSATAADIASDWGSQLGEIIVTAQKREERIQDVPISMSVVNTESLAENSQLKVNDYYFTIPGLSAAPADQGGQNLAIRGIASNAASGTGVPATTGILIDDVPIGTGALFVPDLDPAELQRIEVLRGPQGTLYGSSSMGGLMKFVTIDPSTQDINGRVEAGANHVSNGATGYNFRGAVNLPLTGDLAIRASAFTREDPGYINNPILGITGINVDHTYGGHVTLLWRPDDRFSVKLNATYQHVDGNSTSDETTQSTITGQPVQLGDLQQGYARGSTAYHVIFQAYSAALKYKLGAFEVASITGYNSYLHYFGEDLSALAGSFAQPFGVSGYTGPDDYGDKAYTEELRMAGPLGEKIDARFGLYYDYSKRDPDVASAFATNTLTGVRVAPLATFYSPGPTDESAIFADFTYHLTDRFSVQIGGRESRLRQFQTAQIATGYLIPTFYGTPSPNIQFTPDGKQTPFTYLFSPQFRFSPDLMVYARLASGFRAGAPNPSVAVALGAPANIEPDKTYNYEIGTKGDFFDHKLSLDASVYYIDWKDIQLELFNSAFSYGGNAGSAKSQGVEISLESRPITGLKLAGWIAYDDAKITTFPANSAGFYAAPGDRLPYAAKISGNFSADEEFPLTNSVKGIVGGTLAYIGGRESLFTSTPIRTYLPPYATANLHGGLNYSSWRINTYLNNVTDRRGLISGGLGNVNPYSFYVIQPRTVGLTITKLFE